MTTTLGSEQKVLALRACPVFDDVPAGEIGVLAEMMVTETVAAGELLFEAGEPSDRVYVVVRGRLAVFVAGRAEPVRSLGPGQLLGEYGMFQRNVRTATIRAESEALLISLDYQRFAAFLLQFPKATMVLLGMAVQRLVELERR